MYGNRFWEDSLDGLKGVNIGKILTRVQSRERDEPSSIPRPDLRIGTRDIDSGATVAVVYS